MLDMLVLAINTFDLYLGVAVIVDKRIAYAETLKPMKNQDAHLSGLILKASAIADISLKQIEGMVICSGPGSFTGLRVGSAYAKGFCLAQQAPLAAVSSLKAIAYTAERRDLTLVPMIKARGQEIYHSKYLFKGRHLKQEFDAGLEEGQIVIERLETDALCLGSSDIMERFDFSKRSDINIQRTDPLAVTKAIAIIGAEYLSAGHKTDIYHFEPVYLQNFPR